MPLLSRWTIRLALVYFTLSLLLGGLILWEKGLGEHPHLWRLLPVHIECALFGWTLQLVMGVAYWIFPRYGRPPERRRRELAMLSFLILNIGILLSIVGHLTPTTNYWIFAGNALKLISVFLLALHLFPRIRPFKLPNSLPK